MPLSACLLVVCIPLARLAFSEVGRGCQIPFELELQTVVSHVWMVGTEPGSSARAAGALSCWIVSPDPVYVLLRKGL